MTAATAAAAETSVFRAGWWWDMDRQHEGEFFRAEIAGAVFS